MRGIRDALSKPGAVPLPLCTRRAGPMPLRSTARAQTSALRWPASAWRGGSRAGTGTELGRSAATASAGRTGRGLYLPRLGRRPLCPGHLAVLRPGPGRCLAPTVRHAPRWCSPEVICPGAGMAGWRVRSPRGGCRRQATGLFPNRSRTPRCGLSTAAAHGMAVPQPIGLQVDALTAQTLGVEFQSGLLSRVDAERNRSGGFQPR